MSARWLEVAPGVFAGRHAELDQTIGLVVGTGRCLVVDSGTDEVHGADILAAVRERAAVPWTLVITHAHFDHFFGTAAFLPCPVWAHARCREVIEADGEEQRRDWAARYRSKGEPELARRLEAARLVPPTDVFTDRVRIDLGGRAVELIHPGLGHTDHDVVVHVPDAGVVFAGDLVEQGAPPQVGPDAEPAHWPSTMDNVLALGASVIVPGHGEPVDPAFVVAQRDELAR
jgi:glyoxylase-like metal-dependent hydrolase (beta-lactamase superfamily II)